VRERVKALFFVVGALENSILLLKSKTEKERR
jgi:hypothetical protein